MKKISIIMPVYNAEETLTAAMESILSQDADFELILADDGSTDASLKLAEEISKEDDRVTVLKLDHKGAFHARNEGIRLAKGDYLYFADADDLVREGALKTMALKMEERGADLLTCGYREIRRKDGKEKVFLAPYGEFEGSQIRKNFTAYDASSDCKVLGSCWNKLFLNSLVKEYEIHFPSLMRNEEEAFLQDYLAVCKKIVNIPDLVYDFYPIDMKAARVRLPENFAEEVVKFLDLRIETAQKFDAWNPQTKSYLAKEFWGKMILALKLCFHADGSIDKDGKSRFDQIAAMLLEGLSRCENLPSNVNSSKIYKLLKLKLNFAARLLMKRSI